MRTQILTTHSELTAHRDATTGWLAALRRVLRDGHPRAPRGMSTIEVDHGTTVIPISTPVVTASARRLSYSFAAAEALAILAGDDTVAALAPYNPNIAKYSDDGVVFTGAYGPPVVAQLPYVVGKLKEDPDTRQAVLTIWRPNPPPSKDIPCTLALAFGVRDRRLNAHAFMRSSDVWLGLPYDLLNFSVLAMRVTCLLNAELTTEQRVVPGLLFLTAASSHLYEDHFESARIALAENGAGAVGHTVPDEIFIEARWTQIEQSLIACRDRAEATMEPAWRIRP
jgi:hypothetical protein